jgi:hypothetical protein
MKIVIQCAARKLPGAKTFLTAGDRRVVFVARPGEALEQPGTIYARPDDDAGDGDTWRKKLLAYNDNPAANPLGLLPAYRLYANDAYCALVDRFGLDNVFILSAGWGLIPAMFLTPYYDITFSASADRWKRRRRDDPYEDFCLLPDDGDQIVFLGGKDYLPLFCLLTARSLGRKTVFFNSSRATDLPDGFTAVRYRTTTRTNWHYECARSFIAGELRLPSGPS